MCFKYNIEIRKSSIYARLWHKIVHYKPFWSILRFWIFRTRCLDFQHWKIQLLSDSLSKIFIRDPAELLVQRPKYINFGNCRFRPYYDIKLYNMCLFWLFSSILSFMDTRSVIFSIKKFNNSQILCQRSSWEIVQSPSCKNKKTEIRKLHNLSMIRRQTRTICMIRVDLLIFEFLRIRGLIFPASQKFNNSQILCQSQFLDIWVSEDTRFDFSGIAKF